MRIKEWLSTYGWSILIVLIVSSYMFLTKVMAQPFYINTTTYCVDDKTLAIEVHKVICIEGRCDNVTRMETEVCPEGCVQMSDKGECRPPQTWRNIILILIIIGLCIIIFVARKAKWL